MPELNLKIERLSIPEPPPVGSNLLYVVVHGLVSIVETADALNLFLLNMQSDHDYRAGTWLAEKEVPKGSVSTLKGVKKGSAGVDPTANPVLKIPQPPGIQAEGVHAVFVVPKPKQLLSFNRGEIKIIGGPTSLLAATPFTLAAVRVLVYDLTADFGSVIVSGPAFNWTADKVFTSFPNGSALATFHIFDMPGGPLPDGSPHHVEEFKLSSRVLTGQELVIDSAVPNDVKNGPLPPGLPDLELRDFDARDLEISRVIFDFARTGQWVEGGPVGGTCDSCCGGADGRVS